MAAVRSRYPRKVVEAGPTVAGQAPYSWPSDLLLPLTVSVAGRVFPPSDFDTVRQYEKEELRFFGWGVWYERAGEEGSRKLYIYPAPGEAGLEVQVEHVYEAAALNEDSDEPSEFPNWFHPELCHFVAEVYYDTVEDNPELAEAAKAKADNAVGQLVRYDNERQAGEGVFKVPVAGVDA
jgi:hypothetical protein